MKKFWFVISFSLIALSGISQSTKGITGKPDTSYSINSAYARTIKSNPEAKMVEELYSPNIVEEKNINYCSADDRKLLLDVFYPKQRSSNKRIAVIIVHGGGWRTGNKTLHYAMAQRLAALGYVCFTPEYRLSTEALYPAGVYDIKSTIRWVRKNAAKYNIDENKIAVAGHSAGGELAAMMGATNGIASFEGDGCNKNVSSKVNAVVDIDGLLAFIHPESGEGDDSKRTSAATNWFGYSKIENPELWKQGSPLTHVGQNAAPILFLNSNVARMHAGREDFISVLNRYHIYSEVKTFDAPHSFILFNPWFDSSIVYIDKFLNKVFSRDVGKKPRILISTDIGGTDPDDNQSMTHFLMYSYLFNTEGLVSSPSYGKENKSKLLRMIDLYEKDLPLIAGTKSFLMEYYRVQKQYQSGAMIRYWIGQNIGNGFNKT